MIRALLAAWLVCAACGTERPATAAGSGARPDAPTVPGEGVLALVGVHVVPMDRDTVLRDRTVLVRDGRIERIGPTERIEVPGSARRPDVAGTYLVPGLVDMHVHLARDDLDAYLDAGVTSVRNMWGGSTIAAMRRAVASGEIGGPEIFSTGPAIDGDPPVRPGAEIVADPADAAAVVRGQATEGWAFLKVYQNLERDVYAALIRAAEEVGLPVVGHVPTAVPIEEAIETMASIEHLEGYDKALAGARRRGFRAWLEIEPEADEAMRSLAEATATEGTWNCPTLVVAARVLGRGLPPEERDRAVEARRAMVRALRDAGAPILAGTDGGVPVVPPGALAEELVELVRAGLTPYEAVRAATVDAAAFLGVGDRLGVIAEGMEADLVVLEGDPRQDVATLGDPIAVIVDGTWRSEVAGRDRR